MRHRRARLEHQGNGHCDTIHRYLNGEGHRLVGFCVVRHTKSLAGKGTQNIRLFSRPCVRNSIGSAEASDRTNDHPLGLKKPRRTQMAQRPYSSSVGGRCRRAPRDVSVGGRKSSAGGAQGQGSAPRQPPSEIAGLSSHPCSWVLISSYRLFRSLRHIACVGASARPRRAPSLDAYTPRRRAQQRAHDEWKTPSCMRSTRRTASSGSISTARSGEFSISSLIQRRTRLALGPKSSFLLFWDVRERSGFAPQNNCQ
jgi:hypothetical protein